MHKTIQHHTLVDFIIMKRTSILPVLCILALCSCSSKAEFDQEPVKHDALADYWESGYSGPVGLQAGNVSGVPTILLAGLPLYVTGINCYDLFNGDLSPSGHSNAWHRQVVERLDANEVPIVRFNCGVFSAEEFGAYYDSALKAQYLDCLEDLAAQCDEKHILLIPSFFWNYAAIPEYFEEAPLLESGVRNYSVWGNPDSKTYQMMLDYTKEVVNVLKGHKCIAAWEFGNELNLAADLYKKDTSCNEIYAEDVFTAYKGFASKVKSLDSSGRIICTGNSIMRNNQYNRWKSGTTTKDTFAQYVDVAAAFTPGDMLGMSEHIYDGETRAFKDYGTVSRDTQLDLALRCARQSGKVYYVGEFTGPAGTAASTGGPDAVKSHLDSYLKNKIQISLVWNYAMTCNVEWSFSETQIVRSVGGVREITESDYGAKTFEAMRTLNAEFKALDEK